MRSLLVILLFLLASCSSRDHYKNLGVANKFQIPAVPFVPQDTYQCGPASLAMVLNFRGTEVTAEELATQAFTPGKEGSLQTDMITAVRRRGLLPFLIKDLKSLLSEVSSNNPVIILQNLGLSWYPRWHYAVVIGYDLAKEEMTLHSGHTAYSVMKLFTFENTWSKSKNWGLVIMEPGELPATVSEIEALSAITQLEELGLLLEAKISYQATLRRWPSSFGALLGLGNTEYALHDNKAACEILKKATELFPRSGVAWHNYAWALVANKKVREAKAAAREALAVVEDLLPQHKKNLGEILLGPEEKAED